MTQRKADRLNALLECLNRAGAKGMVRKEVADCLGIKVSPYLNELLHIIVAEGYAYAEWEMTTYPHRWRYWAGKAGGQEA